MDASPSEEFAFAPDSMIWRISRESVVLLGGPAAAILQIADPAIAAGVAAHSNFQRDTAGRLHRTLEAVYAVAFGSVADAENVRSAMAAMHSRVRGTEPVPYDAADPAAQLWVLATLIALSTEVYELVFGPLSATEREAHYRDMRRFGYFFGLDPDFGPGDRMAFDEYYADRLANGELGAHPLTGEIARAIVRPRHPAWLGLVSWPLVGLVTETIPPGVRERLGFRSTAVSRFERAVALRLTRILIHRLPARIRFVPAWHRAVQRFRHLSGERLGN